MTRWPRLVIVLSCAAALLLGASLPSEGASVVLPPAYNTFTPPVKGASYTDPVFGVSIKRLSDAINMPNNANTGMLPFVSTEYSTASPFNSNNSRLILQHHSYFGLYDENGTYIKDLPFVVNASAEPRWSRTDPNLLYYVRGNELMKLDVTTGTSTLIRTFAEYAAIRSRGESDVSMDGDHFVFSADQPAGATPAVENRYVFVYKVSTNTKGPVLDTIGNPFNNLYITPNNGVAIGWSARGTARFQGVELFDRNMTFERQLTHALGHQHLTRDTNGDDVLIWNNSNDPQPIPNCNNGIVKVRLSDARQTCLLQLDWSLAVHITAPDGNGWVFVETYAPSNPAPSPATWPAFTNEIIQLRLDGSEVRRLLHHRSRPINGYSYQPRATLSRDGSRLVFTSNYNLQAILGYSNEYTDAYFVAVPALPPPLISIDDTKVVEGDAGTASATLQVTLSHPSDLPITVTFATADNSATASADYNAISGTLSFAPGEVTKSVVLTANGDRKFEPNETFAVTLGTPTNAILLKATGTVTIEDDDATHLVCALGCDFTRIQDAINASGPGGGILVKSTYDSVTAGEVFPIQTIAVTGGGVTIAGETDGAGSPISTVKFRNGGPSVDGFIMVSPGSVLRDLRIVPGDGTRVNRVIAAARNPGSCPGATCHLSGLTVQNVVIDFSTVVGSATPHFNAGNGIDLLANNVLIDKVTIKGIAGTAIFIDGDGNTIRNSKLDGRDQSTGNANRGVMAVAFGADQKQAGVACSGFPTNYVINNNAIQGYQEGIRWCSGRNNTVSNNTITDISGRGIESSGSRGTQIFGNILQQNTMGGTHGIGLSDNPFQTCTGNTVRNNKVLGRAARDMQRGITVQNCLETTIFQNEVRDFADSAGAIYAVMAAGVATKTMIQGNTVIGGNGPGIVYLGADSGSTAVDQSVIRDNVVNEFKRNGIVVQGIKGVRSGAGAGNVVAYNTVRAANQGSFGDTHGFNLQNLANTAFDRNTALDTKAGHGFFLANSTGVNGNCNTGSTNGAGLFGQVNVTPTYGNANVNCRAALYSVYDFDGDGKSDVTMYRHTTGEWFTKNSSNGADSVIGFGAPGSDDIPAPGKYTTTGKTDQAIYRYTTGEWFIRRATDGGTTIIAFGSPLVGDVPMPADYDGDGLTDLAVFRVSTANAEWYIRRSSDGATQYVPWGCAACADVGVPGDYDGDGKADIAVYRRSTGDWFIRKSTDTSLQQVPFGDVAQGDVPVPGRYTQASKTDMAVYRSLTGEWFIRRSTDFGTTSVAFGVPSAGDFPVSADFTVGGITDIAMYRPTPPTAAFRIRRSTDFGTTIIPYGNPGSQDAPLTAR